MGGGVSSRLEPREKGAERAVAAPVANNVRANHGAFLWACKALNGTFRRLPARGRRAEDGRCRAGTTGRECPARRRRGRLKGTAPIIGAFVLATTKNSCFSRGTRYLGCMRCQNIMAILISMSLDISYNVR